MPPRAEASFSDASRFCHIGDTASGFPVTIAIVVRDLRIRWNIFAGPQNYMKETIAEYTDRFTIRIIAVVGVAYFIAFILAVNDVLSNKEKGCRINKTVIILLPGKQMALSDNSGIFADKLPGFYFLFSEKSVAESLINPPDGYICDIVAFDLFDV